MPEEDAPPEDMRRGCILLMVLALGLLLVWLALVVIVFLP